MRTFAVATTQTPVPAISFTRTSPILTGASTVTSFNARTTSKTLYFGTSVFVLQETRFRSPPDTFTVEVTIRMGFVTSFSAYSFPLGQVFPLTLITLSPSIWTESIQPRGHLIQTNSLFSIPATTPSRSN